VEIEMGGVQTQYYPEIEATLVQSGITVHGISFSP
jgi:hypothetical protein